MNWTVKRIEAKATHGPRHAVLWPHLSRAADCTIAEDEDAGTIHLGVFLADDLVGVCSLFAQRPERFSDALPANVRLCRLRVMGILPEVRGRGAGVALVDRAIEEARGAGAKFLWCDAREIALGFYEKLSFKFVSEAYNVPGIGLHRMMARRL